VAEERWGSLGQLTVSAAASRAAPAHAHLHAIKDRRRGIAEKGQGVSDEKVNQSDEKPYGGRGSYLKDVSLRHPDMRTPKVRDSLSWRKRKEQNISEGDSQLISAAASYLNKFTNDGSFMRDVTKLEESKPLKLDFDEPVGPSSDQPPLSANQLAAKAMQLRLKGKLEEAEMLLKQAETVKMKLDGGENIAYQESRSASRYATRDMSVRQKNKEEDVDMHLAQKIAQNKQYNISGQADDEYDFDDGPSRKKNRRSGGSEQVRDKRNIATHILTQQERCQYCFENTTRPRHLVVSIANFTYLMLPQQQPLVQGHCCILPMQHEAATRNIDDNVWDEIRNFKKCLIMMFAKQEKEVVFLETVVGLSQQRRHCLVECVPLPRELAREAPLYFKKAIDEAEEEWSQHNSKKLIDTSTRGLRGSIPKNFPYFHVEFGLDKGFVHVIDDEKQFNTNLGLNVIRGMLQLPEEDMYRRRKHESVEAQKKAVVSFAREWEPFDWTKALD
ncbi:Cwf19-like protein, partial [Thalictrum thalictroides]